MNYEAIYTIFKVSCLLIFIIIAIYAALYLN